MDTFYTCDIWDIYNLLVAYVEQFPVMKWDDLIIRTNMIWIFLATEFYLVSLVNLSCLPLKFKLVLQYEFGEALSKGDYKWTYHYPLCHCR